MKLRHGFRTVRRELDPQQLAEQVVVAIPDPTSIERDEEQVRALDLAKKPSCVVSTQNGVAKRRSETVQNRRSEQEVPRLARDGVEHLGCQIVRDMTVIGG